MNFMPILRLFGRQYFLFDKKAKSFFEVLVIFNDDNKTPDQALKSF